MKKRYIFLILIALIIGIIAYNNIKPENPDFEYIEASVDNIFYKVSETGTVKQGKEIDIGFESSGQIEESFVLVSDKVGKGQILSKLDTSDLEVQLRQANAGLSSAQANLVKITAPASQEDVQIYETAVENAQNLLLAYQQNLLNTEIAAEQGLNTIYQTTFNTLIDADLVMYNALENLKKNIYITNTDYIKSALEEKEKIEGAYALQKEYLNFDMENVEAVLYKSKESLQIFQESLANIREIWEQQMFPNIPSSYISTLDTDRGYINAYLASILSAENSIDAKKISNQSSIDSAAANVTLYEGNLKTAQANLVKITAPASQEDIDIYQSKIKEAEIAIDIIDKKIENSYLKSPISGIITKEYKKVGEQVSSPTVTPVFSIIPDELLYVEVYISEVDIAKVELNDKAEVVFDAFSDDILYGRVIEIEPSQTLISQVVYYKVKVSIDSLNNLNVKPGMTADVDITTDSRENVLILPKRAVIEEDNRTYVRKIEGNSYKEIEVVIGLKGSDGNVEIISGIEEKDKIITFLED